MPTFSDPEDEEIEVMTIELPIEDTEEECGYLALEDAGQTIRDLTSG